jgi:hypothetical protein
MGKKLLKIFSVLCVSIPSIFSANISAEEIDYGPGFEFGFGIAQNRMNYNPEWVGDMFVSGHLSVAKRIYKMITF